MSRLVLVIILMYAACLSGQTYESQIIDGKETWVLKNIPESSVRENRNKQKMPDPDVNQEIEKYQDKPLAAGWIRLYPQPADGDIRDISSEGNTVCFLSVLREHQTLFFSTDDGNTWSTAEFPSQVEIKDIHLINNILYAASEGVLFSSSNLGSTWEQKLSRSEYVQIHFHENASITATFLTSNSIHVLNSSNGGSTWTENSSPYNFGFIIVNYSDFADQNYGWIYLIGQENFRKFIRTTDGGLSWDSLDMQWLPPYGSFQDFCPVDSLRGFMAANLGNKTILFKTSDGGNNWSENYQTTNMGYVSNFNHYGNEFLYFLFDSQFEPQKIFLSSSSGNIWDSVTSGTHWGSRIYFESTAKGWLAGGHLIRKTYDSGGTWQNNSKTLPSESLTGIAFTSESDGMITTFDGKLLRTSDGGENWEVTLTDSEYKFSDMKFAGTSHGFFLANRENDFPHYARVARTADGGNNWTYTGIDSVILTGISFADSLNGWVVGNTAIFLSGNNIPYVMHTGNSGVSWERQININLSVPSNHKLQSCFFPDAQNGWAVGDYGVLLHTTNGGDSWQTRWGNLDPNLFWSNVQLTDVYFLDADTGYLAGIYDYKQTLFKTTDGGATWTYSSVSNQFANPLWGVHKIYFKDQNNGYWFGYNSYVTSNGGLSWSDYTGILDVIDFSAAENNIWAAGVNGRLYKYTGSPLSTEENNQTNVNDYSLIQNYPNPFNPSTNIKYSVPTLSGVIIKIFDALGREIKTLLNEEKPAGIYEITWHAEGLPSGVYFYQLKAGDFVQTKKMILMK